MEEKEIIEQAEDVDTSDDIDVEVIDIADTEPADDGEEVDPFESLYDDDEEDLDSNEPIEEKAAETVKEESEEDPVKAAALELLSSIGAKDVEDPVKALKYLSAMAQGITPEEYEKRQAAKAKWDEQAKLDIDAIHEAFPETKIYKTLHDLPNKQKFGQLMDNKKTKLTAVEAFAASHPDIVLAHKNLGGRGKSALADTKAHIQSSVPKGAKDNGISISKKELAEYRDMFPDLSDKEIERLYKNAMK